MLGRETERLQGQSSNQLSQLNSTSTELEDSRKLVSEKNATLLQLQQQMEAKVLDLTVRSVMSLEYVGNIISRLDAALLTQCFLLQVQESENLQSSLLEQIDLMQSAAKLAEEVTVYAYGTLLGL